MKQIRLLMVISAGLLIASCNSQNNAAPAKTADSAASQQTSAPASMNGNESKYTPDMVDNKRDLVCKMPVTAGIGDTAHYKGKVYGFCSKQCKDSFLANPESYLAEK